MLIPLFEREGVDDGEFPHPKNAKNDRPALGSKERSTSEKACLSAKLAFRGRETQPVSTHPNRSILEPQWSGCFDWRKGLKVLDAGSFGPKIEDKQVPGWYSLVSWYWNRKSYAFWQSLCNPIIQRIHTIHETNQQSLSQSYHQNSKQIYL